MLLCAVHPSTATELSASSNPFASAVTSSVRHLQTKPMWSYLALIRSMIFWPSGAPDIIPRKTTLRPRNFRISAAVSGDSMESIASARTAVRNTLYSDLLVGASLEDL